MILYEKVMVGKRTTYKPYVPPDCTMHEIEVDKMITLLTTLTVSMLMSVEQQMPPHARVARELDNVIKAVMRLAKLNAAPLDDHLVNIGVAAWNNAIKTMQSGLSGGVH